MSTMERVATLPAPTSGGHRVSWAVSDAFTIARRNLLKYIRIPTLLIFSTVQPIMFVVLFRYVFGGAIRLPPGLHYVDYLMPGIFIQTVVFGSTQTGVGLAEDLQGGMVERFRSLPMARSAVLAGRTLSDVVRNVFVVLLMTFVGFAVGYRIHGGIVEFLGAMVLAVLFGFAFSWIMAWIGLSAGNVEAAQAASFVWVFPFVFASTAFVPLATMPGWLQAWAKVNPVSVIVDGIRALTLHPQVAAAVQGGSRSTHIWQALGWIAGILLVFVPLSVRKYRRAT